MQYTFSPKALTEATQVYLVSKDTAEKHLSQSLRDSLKFSGKYKQVAYLPESNSIYIGVTKESSVKSLDVWNEVDFYELGAAVVNAVAKTSIDTFTLQGFAVAGKSQNVRQEALLRFALGMHQAAWKLDIYLADDKKKSKSLTLSLAESESALKTLEMERELAALATGVTLTREVVDLPPEAFNPSTVVDRIRAEFEGQTSVEIKVLYKDELEKMGMGAFLAVGRASVNPPVLSHVIIKPQGEVKKRIALVGKGLTYDCGGLDIKVGGFMKTMKMDMGGSATMFGTMKALSLLDLEHTEVHWISAFAENMVGGNAYKSDDILTSYSGQTIEVINTDAEGRLTLADALTYATLQNPEYIIDAATLTGACVRALTEHFTALMGNDQGLIDMLQETFVEEQEKTIHVPMSEVLREQVQGDIADLLNLGKDAGMGGHITAGLFLSHFVDQTLFRNPELDIQSPKAYKWAHLDIAGSAYNKGKNPIGVNGATGQTVRSLVRFVQKIDQQ